MESYLQALTDFIGQNWYFLIFIAFLLWLLNQQRNRATVYKTREEFDKLISAGLPVIAEFYNDA